MAAKVKTVDEYIRDLVKSKKGKPKQISEALEIYLEMWQKAVEKGVVKLTDDIGAALAKVDESGGLYKVSSD